MRLFHPAEDKAQAELQRTAVDASGGRAAELFSESHADAEK